MDLMEAIAPASLAEAWDNVGLQVGDIQWPVEKVWVALDPTPEVIEAACAENVDLLITHHPFIFSPLTAIDFSRPPGKMIYLAGKHALAIFSAHTNLDNARNGLNDILARKIGLKDIQILTPFTGRESLKEETEHGTGRIGNLEDGMALTLFADRVCSVFESKRVKVAGDPDLRVHTVAVCTGSGSSMMDAFIASNAHVFISGDLRYHDARRVEQEGRAMIDIGHFASEWIVVDELVKRLQTDAVAQGFDIAIEACTLEKDPFWSIHD